MKLEESNNKMPEKALTCKQSEPLNTKALRSTKDKFISKHEAQEVFLRPKKLKTGPRKIKENTREGWVWGERARERAQKR